jgi:uracil-DNA glycosylase family 4
MRTDYQIARVRRRRTPLPESLVAEWNDCKRCKLHRFRHNVVLGEGSIPAKVMFISEGPGPVENMNGRPFVGPSGKMLKYLMMDAAHTGNTEIPSYFITNVVACIPRDSWSGKPRDPTPKESSACLPRVKELYDLIQPKLVVSVGDIARQEIRRILPPADYHIYHPAYLLRSGGVESRGYLSVLRMLVTIFKEVE